MLKKIPQQQETLVINSVCPTKAIKHINSYIETHSCENMSIDISFMNIIDSCYVTTLCASKHFSKYPNGKIKWKISSKDIEEFNKDFELGNNIYTL